MTNVVSTFRDVAINKFLARSLGATVDQVALLFFHEPWRTLAEFNQYHGTGDNRARDLIHAGFLGKHSYPIPVLDSKPCLFDREKGLHAAGYTRDDRPGFFSTARRLSKGPSSHMAHTVLINQFYVDLRLLGNWRHPFNLCFWQWERDMSDRFSIGEEGLSGTG